MYARARSSDDVRTDAWIKPFEAAGIVRSKTCTVVATVGLDYLGTVPLYDFSHFDQLTPPIVGGRPEFVTYCGT